MRAKIQLKTPFSFVSFVRSAFTTTIVLSTLTATYAAAAEGPVPTVGGQYTPTRDGITSLMVGGMIFCTGSELKHKYKLDMNGYTVELMNQKQSYLYKIRNLDISPKQSFGRLALNLVADLISFSGDHRGGDTSTLQIISTQATDSNQWSLFRWKAFAISQHNFTDGRPSITYTEVLKCRAKPAK